jgi:hypothetical protein
VTDDTACALFVARCPGDETVIEFELAVAGSGDACTVARAGNVRGCVRY